MFKDLEHKKIKHHYVESQFKDAQTIEMEIQTTNKEFSKLKLEFHKVNNAATEQKSHTDAINLIDDILDEDNVGTEDIWREEDLFDDTQTINYISKEIINVADPIETIILPEDSDKITPIETITIEDNIGIPFR